jgi:hypothetical protein
MRGDVVGPFLLELAGRMSALRRRPPNCWRQRVVVATLFDGRQVPLLMSWWRPASCVTDEGL